MSMRVPYLVVGAAAGLGTALWLEGIMAPAGLMAASSAVSTIMEALVVVATSVLAMLATAAGALVTSDWQADVQSRRAWAQLGLKPAELSLRVDPETAWDIDPRYWAPADNEALQQVLRAHRFALSMAVDHAIAEVPAGVRAGRMVVASVEPFPAQSTRDAEPKSARDQESGTGTLSEADTSGRALGKLIDAGAAVASKLARSHRAVTFRVKRAAAQPRLVANSPAWADWLARDARIPVSHTADVIVLGSRQDDRTRPLPAHSVGQNVSECTAPASCRGPQRQARAAAGTTSEQRQAQRASAVPATIPIVRDDLGQEIPICAAELDVIETYLGHVLADLLVSSTDGSEQAKGL